MFKTLLTGGLLCAAMVFVVLDEVSAERGGNEGTTCDSSGPDVIVGDIRGISNYSSVNGIEAYAFGTESCNIGDEELWWYSNTPDKPIIGQSVYRLKDGQFDMLGQGWLKNGFFALSDNWCGCGCAGTNGDTLGVGCSDLYSSSLNGQQSNMSPKFEVDAFTGIYPFPGWNMNSSSDEGIYKRVQVHISDLDPNENGGGQYFVEAQYVSPDDAAAGNQNNNSSWRELSVSGGGSSWNFSYVGDTNREQQAMYAWKAIDPQVQIGPITISNEGLVLVGSHVTDLGDGMYAYEYAVQNVNSDRSISSFEIPIVPGAQILNVGFNDVDYHSGSPIDGTEWSYSITSDLILWECPETYDDNEWANAIRWGTTYSFRFWSNAEPVFDFATLGIFKPPSGESTTTEQDGRAWLPIGDVNFVDCNSNGVADEEDISNGTSEDCNSNGLPDECETDVECPPDLSIVFVGTVPSILDPAGGTTVTVQVEELLGTLDSVTLEYVADGGSPVTLSFNSIGGGQHEAVFPSFACNTEVEWMVTAVSSDGNEYTLPDSGDSILSFATEYTIAFVDDGEDDIGWTVSGDASDGQWDRGYPINCERGDPDADGDLSGQCWLTDNSSASNCNSDVDGGVTTLTSPVLDVSTFGSTISYLRWFSNDYGASPSEDVMVVEVSDDGGANWVELETIGPNGSENSGGWFTAEFLVTGIPGIVPSDDFHIRFSVSDEQSGSVIEAAVDGLMIVVSDCEDVGCDEDVNGDTEVDVTDLLQIISDWNCAGDCPSDVNGDLIVNVADLLAIIAAWGNC